jgi:hypothetical protein
MHKQPILYDYEEIPIATLLEPFDDISQTLTTLTNRLQEYEHELKLRRKGKILSIPLKACQGLKLAIYEWEKLREVTDRLRQLRNGSEEEQEPYKYLITLVTEAQYSLAEIFADATTGYEGKEFFGSGRK